MVAEVEPEENQQDYELGSKPADYLDINGGLVLFVVGIALIIGSGLLANHQAVAPFFVSFGSILVILGAFYSRIEGRLDAGKGGIKTVVASVRKQAREAALSPQAEIEAVQLAVERYLEQKRAGGNWQQLAEAAANEAISQAKSSPMAKAEFLETAFEEWLFDNGFVSVERSRPGVDRGYDLVAYGYGQALIAQIRVMTRNASNAIRGFSGISLPNLERAPEQGPGVELRRAIVVPSGAQFTQAARDFALKANVEIYSVDGNGGVTQLQPSRPD